MARVTFSEHQIERTLELCAKYGDTIVEEKLAAERIMMSTKTIGKFRRGYMPVYHLDPEFRARMSALVQKIPKPEKWKDPECAP